MPVQVNDKARAQDPAREDAGDRAAQPQGERTVPQNAGQTPPQEGEITSRGVPATEAFADQKNAQQGIAKDQPGAEVDMTDVPLEDDPKRLAELQAQAPQPDRGTPILRRNAYDQIVVDHI